MRFCLWLTIVFGCVASLSASTLEEVGQVSWLDQEVRVEAQGLPLEDLLNHIVEQVDGLSLSIDPGVAAHGQDRVWVFVDQATVREVLQVVVQHGTAAQDDSSILIAKPNALMWTNDPVRLQDMMEVRRYAVDSLLAPGPVAQVAELGFRPKRSRPSYIIMSDTEINPAWDIGMLQARIEDSCMPALWLQEGGAVADVRQGGTLVIRHLPSIHQRIAAMLRQMQTPTWSMRVQVVAIGPGMMIRQGDPWQGPLPPEPAHDFWLQGRLGERVSHNALQERRYPGYASIDEEGGVTMRQGIIAAGLSMRARLNPFPGGYVLNYAIQSVDDLGDREIAENADGAPQLSSWLSRSSLVLDGVPEQPMVLGVQTAADGQRFAIVARVDAPESPAPATALPIALANEAQAEALAKDMLLAQARAQGATSLRITAQAADLLENLHLSPSRDMHWDDCCSLLADNDVWINDDGRHWLVSADSQVSAIYAEHPLADLLQPSPIILSRIAPLAANPQAAQNPSGHIALQTMTPLDSGEITDQVQISLQQHEYHNMRFEMGEAFARMQISAPPFIQRKIHDYISGLRSQTHQRIAVELLRLPKNKDLPPVLSPQASAELLSRYPVLASAIHASTNRLDLGYQRQHSYRGFVVAGKNILPGYLPGLHYHHTGLSMSVEPIIHPDNQHLTVHAVFREASDPVFTTTGSTESPQYRYHHDHRNADIKSGSAVVIHGRNHSYVAVFTIIAHER